VTVKQLLERISARASDGRYYLLEDNERELIIKLLNKIVDTTLNPYMVIVNRR